MVKDIEAENGKTKWGPEHFWNVSNQRWETSQERQAFQNAMEVPHTRGEGRQERKSELTEL